MDKQEHILCAAIWYQDHDIELIHGPGPSRYGRVLCGHRHAQIIELWHSLTGGTTKMPHAIQGFLTSSNRFVSRSTAGKIAFRAGQTEREHGELTSEDIY